jgi:hypothetical protein
MNHTAITSTENKTGTPEVITTVSKTLISISSLILVIATGLLSLSFFRKEEYDFSWMLTIASYLSIVLGVYVLSSKKPVTH